MRRRGNGARRGTVLAGRLVSSPGDTSLGACRRRRQWKCLSRVQHTRGRRLCDATPTGHVGCHVQGDAWGHLDRVGRDLGTLRGFLLGVRPVARRAIVVPSTCALATHVHGARVGTMSPSLVPRGDHKPRPPHGDASRAAPLDDGGLGRGLDAGDGPRGRGFIWMCHDTLHGQWVRGHALSGGGTHAHTRHNRQHRGSLTMVDAVGRRVACHDTLNVPQNVPPSYVVYTPTSLTSTTHFPHSSHTPQSTRAKS